MVLHTADIAAWVARMWWPVLRIGGFVLTAPIASEATVPTTVKIVLTLALALLAAPWAQAPADLSIFSAAGGVAALQELLIGIAIGTVVQLSFDAVELAGQSISMTMGCEEQFRKGFFRYDDRLRDRRFLLIDEERGLVLASALMDHAGRLRTYRLTDGTMAESHYLAPHSYYMFELFKLSAQGRIRQIEADFVTVPYNMPLAGMRNRGR